MKRILLALALLALGITPALAQGTPKTKAALSTEITTNFPDNVVGAITPAILRATTLDMLASWQQYASVSAQTAASYTVALSDYGQLVTVTNASPIAVTLPQATGSFQTFSFFFKNVGATTATITPITSTINGAASLAVTGGNAFYIVSDGTNWQAVAFGGVPSGAAGGELAGTYPNPTILRSIAPTWTQQHTFNSGNTTFGGTASPGLTFNPSSGATKQGLFYQSGDTLNLAAQGIGNYLSINLVNGFTAHNSLSCASCQPDALLTVNANTAASSAGVSGLNGVNLHLVGADGVFNRIWVEAFGSTATFGAVATGGTNAARTQTLSGQTIFSFGGLGWTSSNAMTTTAAQILFASAEAYTPTAQGNRISFYTVPVGTVLNPEILRLTGAGAHISATAVANPDALLTINGNTASAPAPPGGATYLHTVAADASVNFLTMDSFGQQSIIIARRAQGTLAAKSAVVANNVLQRFGGEGWDSSVYSTNSSFAAFNAAENFSTTAHGTYFSVNVTPVTTTSFVEALRVTGAGVNIAPLSGGVNPDAPLTVSANTVAAAVGPIAGTVLHVMGADATLARITLDGYGNIPFFNMRSAAGTAAAPTATAINTFMGGFAATGFAGSGAYATSSSLLLFQSTENYTPTANGSKLLIQTVPNGTATAATVLVVNQSGGLSIGSANTATDPGNNIALATGLQSAPTTVASVGTCNAAAKGTRKFVTDVTGTPTWHQTLPAGGSSGNYGVICDGTNWYIQ